jgi:hypothetical protein
MRRTAILLPAGLFLTALLASAAGCGRAKPQPANAELARETLRTALETWKQGESPDSLRSGTTPIHVADQDWTRGAQLLDYQIDLRDQMFGGALRCQVKLSLQDPRGKKRIKKAIYSIATEEVIFIAREDDK